MLSMKSDPHDWQARHASIVAISRSFKQLQYKMLPARQPPHSSLDGGDEGFFSSAAAGALALPEFLYLSCFSRR